jgi:hypothetical protein
VNLRPDAGFDFRLTSESALQRGMQGIGPALRWRMIRNIVRPSPMALLACRSKGR